MTEIFILTNDFVRKQGFLGEHGSSIFIRYGTGSILFDAGQSDVFIRNAQRMGIDVAAADGIVLSHGHYDHCGGIGCLSDDTNDVPVYIDRSAFEYKYALNADGSFRYIGIPDNVRSSAFLKRNIVSGSGSDEIMDGVFILSGISKDRLGTYTSGDLYVKRGDEMLHDEMKDEQMLVIDDNEGLCVFLGCSHPGVINCIRHALDRFSGRHIKALFAGMHLGASDERHIREVMDFFDEADIGHIFPLHCTGITAVSEMKKHFKERCTVLYSGDSVTI